MTAPRRPSYALATLLALIAAALVLKPLASVSWWQSHDMVAYPVRLIEFCQALRLGQRWPRWGPDLYGGYGAPLFNFYPPGAVAPAAALYLAGVKTATALKASLFLYTALGLAAAFLAGELLTKRRDAGVVALVVFAASPYRFTQLMQRGDLAEYCATALAMVALYAYLSMRLRGPTVGRCLCAALAHASIMLTHTITGQWSTELLGLVVAWWVIESVRARDPRSAGAYAATFLGALGLMTIYVLPALAERDLVRIKDMATGNFATEANFLRSIFDLVMPTPALVFFFVGWPAVVALFGTIFAAVGARARYREFMPWAIATALLVLLMCELSAPVWKVLPFGRFIMFPWRLLAFFSITSSLLCATLWAVGVPPRSKLGLVALLLATLAVGWRTHVEQPPPLEVAPNTLPGSPLRVAHEIHSTVIFDEYLPLTVPRRPQSPVHNFVVALSPNTGIEKSKHNGIQVLATVDAADQGWVDIAYFSYPGWKIRTIEGPAPASLATNADGLVRVELPTAGHYELIVEWGTTPLRIVATTITLATLALLPIALLLLLRRRKADAA